MKVSEAMTKRPIRLRSDSTVCDAANLMKSKRIGSILIVDEGKLIGVVTERDIITRAVADYKDPKKIMLRDIMSKPVICIDESEELVDASELMKRHDIRRLAVLNKEGKLVGIITNNDIASSLRRSAEELAITYYIMSRRREGR